MSRWVVVESTPGYLPENDDPATFTDLAEARAYAESLADEALEALYGWPEDGDEAYADSARVTREHENLWRVVSDRPHDLGRVVEVLPLEGT